MAAEVPIRPLAGATMNDSPCLSSSSHVVSGGVGPCSVATASHRRTSQGAAEESKERGGSEYEEPKIKNFPTAAVYLALHALELRSKEASEREKTKDLEVEVTFSLCSRQARQDGEASTEGSLTEWKTAIPVKEVLAAVSSVSNLFLLQGGSGVSTQMYCQRCYLISRLFQYINLTSKGFREEKSREKRIGLLRYFYSRLADLYNLMHSIPSSSHCICNVCDDVLSETIPVRLLAIPAGTLEKLSSSVPAVASLSAYNEQPASGQFFKKSGKPSVSQHFCPLVLREAVDSNILRRRRGMRLEVKNLRIERETSKISFTVVLIEPDLVAQDVKKEWTIKTTEDAMEALFLAGFRGNFEEYRSNRRRYQCSYCDELLAIWSQRSSTKLFFKGFLGTGREESFQDFISSLSASIAKQFRAGESPRAACRGCYILHTHFNAKLLGLPICAHGFDTVEDPKTSATSSPSPLSGVGCLMCNIMEKKHPAVHRLCHLRDQVAYFLTKSGLYGEGVGSCGG